MPRNDDGEYELVLGNRQLLSGFFIVVVMFGVFFTMGYFVGRHSTPSNISAASTPSAVTPASMSTPPATIQTSTAPPEPGRAALVTAEEVKKPVTTQPVTAPPEPPKTVANAETKPETRVPPVAAPVRKTEPKPAPATAGGLQKVTPAAGDIFLQVSAPAVAAAASVVEALRKKGIQSVVAAGPDDSTVRVLVGPLVPADIPAERAKLEGVGFKPFVRKY